MLNADNMKDAEQRRLAWRCRRGMLELDIVLQRFIAQHFNHLTLNELHVFDEMLELPDNDLWNALQLKNLHLKSHDLKTKAQQSIMDKLHALQAA
jgi:antitoxin CptB